MAADPSRAVLVVGWRGLSIKWVTAFGLFGFVCTTIVVLAVRQRRTRRRKQAMRVAREG